MHHIHPRPYRSTVWQYSPKKYSEGPQVPSDPPPSCLFSQASAGESLLLHLPLVFMVVSELWELRGFSLRGAVWSGLLISCLLRPRCGAVRCGALAPLLVRHAPPHHPGEENNVWAHRTVRRRGRGSAAHASLTRHAAPSAGQCVHPLVLGH